MKRVASVVLMLAALRCGAGELVTFEKSIPLPNVEGRIDHLAIDLKTQRVFIAALGNNSVEVVDTAKGERVQTIKGLDEPQGVAFVADINQIVIANGGDGSCRFYDAESFKLLKSIDLKSDADNVRYDAATKRIYAGHGGGALAALDAAKPEFLADAKLSDHPESFQLETQGARIFVNVPQAKKIEVVDRSKNEVIATWKLKGAHANYPMTLDESTHRLFAGCRSPAKILVFDTESGAEVAVFDCAGDTDDIFFDAQTKRLYVIGGEGKLEVFTQTDADHYTRAAEVKTATGARTGLFVPELKRIFIAVPHRNDNGAELRVYRLE